MVELSLTLDTKAFELAVKKIPNLLNTSLTVGFDEIGDEFVSVMQDVFTTQPGGPFGGNTTKTKLINRTGNLRQTLRQRVFTGATVNDLALRVTIGDSTTPYARIQEEGGTIKPKRAKKLAIPLPANKTNAGRTRFAPRAVPGGFILPLANNTFIARKDESGQLELMFVLKDEVTIPARLGMRRRWATKKMQTFRNRVINRRVSLALQKAGLA